MLRPLRYCPRCKNAFYHSSRALRDDETRNTKSRDAMSARLVQLEDDAIHLKSRDNEDLGQPWQIDDSPHRDSLLRMRLDTNRLTYASTSYTPIAMPSTGANFARMDKRTGERMKVAKARESVSVHRTKKEFEKSREYQAVEEAFYPMPNSLEGLQSLAEERIHEARRNGAFKNLSGKGKKLVMEETKVPMVDRTEFFLNQILKSQGALPPVLDGLASVETSIRTFRSSIRSEWINFCCKLIAHSGVSLDRQVQRARSYGLAESTGIDRLRDPNWEKRELPFIKAQITEINSKIMSVNVIAPYNCRRGYLKIEDELQACYKGATPLVADMLIERSKAPKLKDSPRHILRNQHLPLLNHFGKGSKSEFYERSDRAYGFKDWFKDTFSKNTPIKTIY